MKIKTWNIEEITGYKPITTFFEDFSIAEGFGISAIKDTYKRAMEEWSKDYKYLTELVMVLNWKIWDYYGKNDEYADLYERLWGEADQYAAENLEGDGLAYFYRTTD